MTRGRDRTMTAGDAIPVDHLFGLLARQNTEFAVMLIDGNGRIVWWGPGAEKVFGFSSAEMVGHTTTRLFVPEDVASGVPQQEIAIATKDGAADDDRWLVRRDGSRFWASGSLVGFRDDSGRLLMYAKILRNRTPVKEQLETLRNQIEALASMNRRKDVFLSTLSHELRNPLAPLSYAVELIKLTAPNTPDLEHPLKVIDRQIDILRRLVDDLLDLSRIAAGKISLQRTITPLHEILEHAIKATEPGVRGRNHRIHVFLPTRPVLIDGDRDRLEQVFVNLIDNAVKFTPPGGQIWVKATVEGNEAVVGVEDNGIGISHEMLPRIFELFTQAPSLNRTNEGLGIGLALVKDLVSLHGGSVQVRSEGLGAGSEFIVRLPLKPPVV